MTPLALHELHSSLGAQFSELAGMEIVDHYGDPAKEYRAITETAAALDLSFRGRLCLTGSDRVRFLNGQVTNDVKTLAFGHGCAAAFCSPKGRLVADVHVFALAEELLLDFEPGLTVPLAERLQHHIVAEDVQVIDVAPFFGLLSVQGPRAAGVIGQLGLFPELPASPLSHLKVTDGTLGEIYLVQRSRAGLPGFDLFVGMDALAAVFDKLCAACTGHGGGPAGFAALDLARFEAGVPRFPVEMDETNLPPEAGLDRSAISYSKGCYTGQETIARLRTYGQVTKALRGLRLPADLTPLPAKGTKLAYQGRDAGYIVSAHHSPKCQANLALAYVRREANSVGTELTVKLPEREVLAHVVALPFAR